MKKRSILNFKVACVSMATVLLFSTAVNASTTDLDNQQSSIEQEQDDLQSELSVVRAELEALKDQEDKALEYQEKLSEQINLIEDRVIATMASVEAINDSITELDAQIAEAGLEYEDTLEQLKERIKTLYTAGDITSIEMLLNSDSIQDFAYKTELLKSVSKNDKYLMDEITEYVNLTQDDRDAREEQREQVANLQKQLEADKEELTGLYLENEELVEDLKEQKLIQENELANLEVENAEYNAQISALIAQKVALEEQERLEAEANKQPEPTPQPDPAPETEDGEEGTDGETSEDTTTDNENDAETDTEVTPDEPTVEPTPPTSNGLAGFWPIPGYGHSYIYRGFGSGHYGVDISVPAMTPVVAVSSGEVLSASYRYDWGNNVLIYHNSTYTTRYAHLEVMAVSTGQYVSAGQIIGYVGSTGYSTGPHLHLEVYQNGYRVDPMPYI